MIQMVAVKVHGLVVIMYLPSILFNEVSIAEVSFMSYLYANYLSQEST